MTTGFVIGKFFPFHFGHMYLLDVARAHSDKLIVWVCEKATQEISGDIRVAWIRELYPDVDVRLVPDTLGDDDTNGWAEYTLRVLGRAPDVVFTSEDYGEAYAKAMGSKHFLVDRERGSVSVSGTKVRANTFNNWQFLAPPVRAYFAKKVVIIGAESTGTTTLTRDLADKYKTVWVPEYGRDFAESKSDRGVNTWNSEEFIHIAAEQLRREDEAARQANAVLFCDTDAFATTLWHERYMGSLSPYVEKIANSREHDLYILTGDEIPFVQDGYRDGERIRHDMHNRFLEELRRTNRPFIEVHGSKEERLAEASIHVGRLLSRPLFGRE